MAKPPPTQTEIAARQEFSASKLVPLIRSYEGYKEGSDKSIRSITAMFKCAISLPSLQFSFSRKGNGGFTSMGRAKVLEFTPRLTGMTTRAAKQLLKALEKYEAKCEAHGMIILMVLSRKLPADLVRLVAEENITY